MCFAMGPQNSCHLHNQSDAKLKPIVMRSSAFSRAWGRLHFLIGFIVMLSSVLIGRSVYFGFFHTTFGEKSSCWAGLMNNHFVGERHLWWSLRRIKASRRLNCEQFWQNGQVTKRWSRKWFVQTSFEFRSLFCESHLDRQLLLSRRVKWF